MISSTKKNMEILEYFLRVSLTITKEIKINEKLAVSF